MNVTLMSKFLTYNLENYHVVRIYLTFLLYKAELKDRNHSEEHGNLLLLL